MVSQTESFGLSSIVSLFFFRFFSFSFSRPRPPRKSELTSFWRVVQSDHPGEIAFDETDWLAYRQANLLFAEAVQRECSSGDIVWVQGTFLPPFLPPSLSLIYSPTNPLSPYYRLSSHASPPLPPRLVGTRSRINGRDWSSRRSSHV